MESTPENYFNLVPSELIEIIVSYLKYNDLQNFIETFQLTKLNWNAVHKYHFGNYPKSNSRPLTYSRYQRLIGVEGVKIILGLKESIEEITSMKVLTLSNKELYSIPSEIFSLENLKILVLNRNHITSIPKEISKLFRLQELWIGKNELSSLPIELVQLEGLQLLDISFNKFTELPVEIFKFSNLDELHIRGNLFTIGDSIKNKEGFYI